MSFAQLAVRRPIACRLHLQIVGPLHNGYSGRSRANYTVRPHRFEKGRIRDPVTCQLVYCVSNSYQLQRPLLNLPRFRGRRRGSRYLSRYSLCGEPVVSQLSRGEQRNRPLRTAQIDQPSPDTTTYRRVAHPDGYVSRLSPALQCPAERPCWFRHTSEDSKHGAEG